MNDNLNIIVNISDFKKDFLYEITELFDNVEKIQDNVFSTIEKENSIKSFF